MALVKIFEGREGHIRQKDGDLDHQLACSNDSLAGAVSQRACVYSGARVVLNPVTDALHLVHGPIGCASYTWDIRGSSTSGPDLYKSSFSTDMKEIDVIFGGEKKLALALRELAARYHPPAIFVYSTCIVGVIGDDLGMVCRRASEELKIPVIPVRSEGFKGNKKEGYKAACNALMELIESGAVPDSRKVSGSGDAPIKSPCTINLLGEYNVAGDLWSVRPYFEEMGIEVVASLTGDSRVSEIQKASQARLNLVQCSGSMTFLAKKMEERYGIPYQRISFFGVEDMSSALRIAAGFFKDPEITSRAEAIISREVARIAPQIEHHRSRVAGRLAAIYMGGAAKAVSLVKAFRELGMEVVIIGTQTGDRDDYQKISYLVRDGTVIIDDANPLELKELLVTQKADLLVAGVKERFLAYKLGIAFCDFNHDRTTTFEGYNGMANFAREVDTTINSPVWRLSRERRPGSSRSAGMPVEGRCENASTGGNVSVEELCDG
ncbi:MAG TPA: nitrogenase iron-molybdenum cofactor biosynthesis protein NifE [Methanotrichaceae archaeon]|nr:nitrogenase iron-molybdenum cofactor biosynthesis protein NifE [Methanotrichaceae archaeon]